MLPMTISITEKVPTLKDGDRGSYRHFLDHKPSTGLLRYHHNPPVSIQRSIAWTGWSCDGEATPNTHPQG